MQQDDEGARDEIWLKDAVVEGTRHPRRPWWAVYRNGEGEAPLVWLRRAGTVDEVPCVVPVDTPKLDGVLAKIDRKDPLSFYDLDEAEVVNREIMGCVMVLTGMAEAAPHESYVRDYSLGELLGCTHRLTSEQRRAARAREAAVARGEPRPANYDLRLLCDDRMLAALYALWHHDGDAMAVLTLPTTEHHAVRALFVLEDDTLQELGETIRDALDEEG